MKQGRGFSQSGCRRDIRSRPQFIALAVAACFATTHSLALPSAPHVLAGAAGFSQAGSALTVTNAPGTIIQWQSFSIGALERVRFAQENSLSAVLNRVAGPDASRILGELTSNGRVWLVNPNGILFGAGSRIDVNGLVAATLDVSDSDFRAGRMNFATGATAGSIRNAGDLRAAGDGIYLIAPDIENSGIVRAPNGEVLLAAGRQVSLVEAGHPDIQVVVSAPEDRAVNLGTLAAGHVSVFGSLVRHEGGVSADRVEVDARGRIVFRATQHLDIAAGSRTTANGPSGGEVALQSAGDSLVAGTIEATGDRGNGGSVRVLGERVALMDQARIDASGASGGGTILVGGDYQGKNPEIQNARSTYLGPDVRLVADASHAGDGGTVIVWADEATHVHGRISAQGGTISGSGGLVETSGHFLDVRGARVSTQAPAGEAGLWLLDPLDVIIDNQPSYYGSWVGTTPYTFTPYDTPSNVDVTDITDNLALGNVKITTVGTSGPEPGNITVSVPINWSSPNSLTLEAAGSIQQDSDIVNAGSGAILLTANDNIAMGTLGPANAVKSQSSGGFIEYVSTSGSVALGRLEGGTVHVEAHDQILDNNGGGLNVVGSSATLTSHYGGPSGSLAISANMQVGTVNATSNGSASGSIALSNTGALNNVNITGNGGTEADVSLTASGSISVSTVSGTETSVRSTGGNVTVNPSGSILGSSNTHVEAAGSVNVNGGSIGGQSIGASVEVKAGTNINVRGQAGYSGSIWSGGDTHLEATNGKLILTSESPSSGAASVSADDPLTLYLNLPSLSSGGYVVDGVEGGGVVSSYNPNTSLRVAGDPAIVGSNFLISYGSGEGGGDHGGVSPTPTDYSVNTVLAGGYAYHTYGQTPSAVFSYALAPTTQSGETISGTAYFTPTLGQLTPAGTFTVKYAGGLTSSVGSHFSAGTGLAYTINPAVLTATLSGISKPYDGTASATLTPGNFTLSGFVGDDGATILQTSGTFASANAGSGIPVSASLSPTDFSPSGDTLLSNYSLPTTANGIGSITQRASVAWVGGATGQWSAASNWEAGILPAQANVSAVSIPAGATVFFDGSNASLDSLSSQGTLVLNSGTLTINRELATHGYRQSGGVLAGAGSLTVSDQFSMSGGSLAITGPISITQAVGDLIFVNDQPMTLGSLMAPNGSIRIDTIGMLRFTGPVTVGGNLLAAAHSPLQVDAAISASGDISLTAGATSGAGDDLQINAPLSSGGNVALNAGDNLLQSANVSTSGGTLSAQAETGSITMAAGAASTTSGGSISYAAPNGNIQLGLLDAGSGGNIALNAGGNIGSAPGHDGPNLVGGLAHIAAGGSATLTTQVFALSGTVGGALNVINNGTSISNVTETPTPTAGSLEERISCLADPQACGDSGAANENAQETLQVVRQTQQNVVDTSSNAAPAEDGDEREKEDASAQTTGTLPQSSQGTPTHATPNYCN